LGGGLHLPELLELAWVEEDGVRIELVEQAGNRALIEGLFGRDGIGGVQDGIGWSQTVWRRDRPGASVEAARAQGAACGFEKVYCTWDGLRACGKWTDSCGRGSVRAQRLAVGGPPERPWPGWAVDGLRDIRTSRVLAEVSGIEPR
jgi:hypothetical protein